MPQLYPLYTQQPYIGTEGKVLRADRLYLAPNNAAQPTAALHGATAGGTWVDVGSLDESLATLEKADAQIVDVVTGLFQILRNQVAKVDGVCTAKCNIVEYDTGVWAAFTGDATHSLGAGTNNAIFVGGNPLLKNAVLLVGQNAATTTEYHHYNPTGSISWKLADLNRFQAIETTVHFLKYQDGADTAGLFRDFELSMWA